MILGGSGSLAGAAGGAAIFVLLRDQLSSGSFWSGLSLPPELAAHWQLVMGLLFIVVVLASRDGLYGRLGVAARGAARAPPAAVVSGDVLQALSLCKSFGSLRVTDDVSLRLPAGRRHGLIGPNGAGKTTLFNLITGQVKADAGDGVRGAAST